MGFYNSYNFSNGNNAGTPLLITAAIQAAGLGAANNYTSNPMYGCPNYLPPSFPLGYNGFWCMKYEATSVSYVDFLNTLSYNQQAMRLSKWGTRYPNSTNTYFGNGGQKGSIYTSVAGTYNTIPATFTYNTSYMNYTPVIYLSWTDLTTYLDWAGLRPMNDFEYEKAIADMNRMLAPEVETVFLTCTPLYSTISSTLVRDVIRNNGNVHQFIPEAIVQDFKTSS